MRDGGVTLFKAGYSNNDLRDLRPSGDWNNDVYRSLWTEYKIDFADVSKIIDGNDSTIGSCDIKHFAQREKELDKVFTKIDKKRARVNPFKTRMSNDGTVLGPEPTKAEIKVLEKFDVYQDFLDQDENENY